MAIIQIMKGLKIKRLTNFMQLIFVLIVLTLFFNCTTNTNSHSIDNNGLDSNKLLKNCHNDSMSIHIDTMILGFNIPDIFEVVHNNKDNNGVWFENPISDKFRIVYQGRSKILLVYCDQKLFAKYVNVIVIIKTFSKIRCIDGQAIIEEAGNSILMLNKRSGNIIEIYQKPNTNISSISYFYNNSNEYKGTILHLYINAHDTLEF